MTYHRVIPRDLFNEGNLLKCYGQLYLNLERYGLEDCLIHSSHDGDNTFVVLLNEDTGGTTLENVRLWIHDGCHLERPLNSRRPYPLYLTTTDGKELEVFQDNGAFTDEMLEFLGVM